MTIIQKALHLKGGLSGKGDLTIAGTVEGNINMVHGLVRLMPEGKVIGDIHSREIHIGGAVHGNLFAAERLVIDRTAEINGDISTSSLNIEPGARVTGNFKVDPAPNKSL